MEEQSWYCTSPFRYLVEVLVEKFPSQLASVRIACHCANNLNHILRTNLTATQSVLEQPLYKKE